MEQILAVAIGVVLVCLLLSIIASHICELAAAFTAKRAAMLEKAIRKMLVDPNLYETFAAHPLIETISFTPAKLLGLGAARKSRPTYIPSPLFTRVLLVSLAEMHDAPFTDIPRLIDRLPPDSALRKKLSAIILGIEGNAAACTLAIEQWYDGTMDRVNGLYKRRTQMWLVILGMALAIVFNANLFNVTQKLWTSKDARDAVTATAQMYSCKDKENCTLPDYATARKDIQDKLGDQLPLGYTWKEVASYWQNHADLEQRGYVGVLGHWGYNLAGWLLTAIAVSLGAPFWFDLLNKLVNLRLAGLKPPKAEPPPDVKGSVDLNLTPGNQNK
ncbi:MAG TPA: hypothetical protein VHB45_11295 [Alloacidobacterium sp.]|nr:hypothetical protein [Alloacidobacterium sp.]